MTLKLRSLSKLFMLAAVVASSSAFCSLTVCENDRYKAELDIAGPVTYTYRLYSKEGSSPNLFYSGTPALKKQEVAPNGLFLWNYYEISPNVGASKAQDVIRQFTLILADRTISPFIAHLDVTVTTLVTFPPNVQTSRQTLSCTTY